MNFHLTQSLFADGLLAFVVIRTVYQRRAARVQVRFTRTDALDRSLVGLMVLGQFVVPGFYILSRWLDVANFDAPGAALPLGVVAWLAGLWLFWRSHRDLGDNWSVTLTVRDAHELVTRGVYRRVRHPMYASLFLLGLAQALLLPNWIAGGSALVAVAVLCLVRVPREESMMCDVFGDRYRDYRRRTGALVPRFGASGAA